MTNEHDVFISHASEDKNFVRQLAEELRTRGYRVWYDEFSLKLGDSLRSSMDKGLLSTRYAIVVLSTSFFLKQWTQQELNGLTAREVNGQQKIILPIWHEVGYEDVVKYSPTLADKFAVSTSKGMNYVVNKILEVLSSDGSKISDQSEPNNNQSQIVERDYTDSDSELLIAKKRFSRYNVQVTVHDNYALTMNDDYIVSLFDEHNDRRKSKGLIPHFGLTRYRLICPPQMDGIKLKLDVAPINFAYFALLVDPDIQERDYLKTYIDKKVNDMVLPIPQELKSDHRYINEYNYTPLGVEIVLLTNDAKTLLRKRGLNVATSKSEWDVSFSGYCGPEDKERDLPNEPLQMWRTVEEELREEISMNIPRDPNNIYFTTLHRNKRTGATDLLGYWKVDISSEQLRKLISDKYPEEQTTLFTTTEKAIERFVWDTDNIIVEFDGNKIAEALTKAGAGIGTLMPEGRVALNLALQILGKPTLNL